MTHQPVRLLTFLSLSFIPLFLASQEALPTNSENTLPPPDDPEHIIIGYLGAQHLANLVYRRGIEGDKLTGWGRTPITEWTIGSANHHQVVPANENHRFSNGGCAMDIDDDGVDEIIVARGSMANLRNSVLMWYDEVEGKDYWEEHEIARLWEQGFTAPHDIVPYYFESPGGEKTKAIIANKARREVYLFIIPDDPRLAWETVHVGTFPLPNQSGIQIVDINKDGRDDIVSGMYWIEAPENTTQADWQFHQFGNWNEDNKRWGGMNKHGIADFDGDGTLEIVTSEAEIPNARLSLFDVDDNSPESLWKESPIDSGLYTPHSLVVVDLNRDENPDLLVGEMTAGGWDFPYNPNPKIYAYLNRGEGTFEKNIYYEGWGVHEMRILPKTLEGKTVVYAADEIQPQKFNAMNTHVSYWLVNPIGEQKP